MDKSAVEEKSINIKQTIENKVDNFIKAFDGSNIQTKRILYNCIGVIGNAGGVGVSSLVYEIANMYKQSGYSICVVDMDLVKTSQQIHYDNNKVKYSIKDFLNGDIEIKDILFNGAIDYVNIKPYSIIELSQSDENMNDFENAKLLLNKLKDLYDLVIIDFNYALLYFGIVQSMLIGCNNIVKVSSDSVSSIINGKIVKETIKQSTDANIVDILNMHQNTLSVEDKYEVVLPFEYDMARCERYGESFYKTGKSKKGEFGDKLKELKQVVDKLLGID